MNFNQFQSEVVNLLEEYALFHFTKEFSNILSQYNISACRINTNEPLNYNFEANDYQGDLETYYLTNDGRYIYSGDKLYKKIINSFLDIFDERNTYGEKFLSEYGKFIHNLGLNTENEILFSEVNEYFTKLLKIDTGLGIFNFQEVFRKLGNDCQSLLNKEKKNAQLTMIPKEWSYIKKSFENNDSGALEIELEHVNHVLGDYDDKQYLNDNTISLLKEKKQLLRNLIKILKTNIKI